jgi:hypothetical protein
MSDMLDEATRAEYMKLTTAMSIADIIADPAKNAAQCEARKNAIERLLTQQVAVCLLRENLNLVAKELFGEPNARLRYIVLLYDSTPALLRKLLGVKNERPSACAGMTLDAAMRDFPGSALVRTCDPATQFVFVIGTRLVGDGLFAMFTRTLIKLPVLTGNACAEK